jgi:hypothetical protein
MDLDSGADPARRHLNPLRFLRCRNRGTKFELESF